MTESVIDKAVAQAVRSRLGSVFDDLLAVMIDLAVPPMFLFQDERPRLVAARDRAADAVDNWQADEPLVVADLVSRLPDVLQVPSAAESLLEAAPWEEYFALPEGVLAVPTRDAPVMSAVPDLLDRIDDDGLVDVDGLDARPHGLLVGAFALHYHQLLRRSFQTHIHYGLVGTVLGISARFSATARLAIDERRLRFRDEYEEHFEKDYWYGPPLADESIDDLNAVGETVHGDPKGGLSFINPYAAVSVRWTRDGPLKTVQIEEFLPPPSDEAPWVLARYLHAIRDTSAKAFVHCDGAVKAYLPATYPRVLSDFDHRGKSQRYRKVFRLDGTIPTDAWSEVTAQWFRGNQLVPEYLSSLSGG